MPKETIYKFTLGIGFVNAEHEEEMTVGDMGFDEDEWQKLKEEEKESELVEIWKDWSNHYIDGGWKKL